MSKNLTKKQKRMRDMVASLQHYMDTYDEQLHYEDYEDETYIDDVLYGLGISMEPEVYKYRSGFDLFKEKLLNHLSK